MPKLACEDLRRSPPKPRLLTSAADWAMVVVIAAALFVAVVQGIGAYLQAMFGAVLAVLGG